MVQFQKAERRRSKMRLALAGPAGSGKTYSSILIAFGLLMDKANNGNGNIAMIDTERGSGELYADLGDYDVCSITSPFEPEKYTDAIRSAEELGYGVIIIDSLSHAWSGEGGLLDLQGHLADRTGNSWAAWRKVTPKHNQLVEAMLQSNCHVIATMRSKMDYAQTTENGKAVVKKLGMNPIQRDGMEYEFTLFLDLDLDHMAAASKDRTTMFDGKIFKPSMDTGKTLIGWLNEAKALPEPTPQEKSDQPDTKQKKPIRLVDSGSDGNGARILFAKIDSYGLNKDSYRAYCYRKYNIESLKKLTSEQREEQIKILNSLKNPERLEEFKRLLSEIPPASNANATQSDAQEKAASNQAPAREPVKHAEAGFF